MTGVPQLPHPFEVFFDEESEKYYIFAPDGCILVDGKEIAIYGASNGNVELSLGSSMPDCLYAHVTADANSTGGYKAEFDGNATKSGAKWDFRVCRFGAAENDGNQYDIATGAINLGSSGGVPGNFEPEFALDSSDDTVKLDDVGDGFWPFGRYFYSAVTVDSSAKIATGMIWLEISHPNPASSTSGTPTPTAQVCGALNGSLSSLPSPTDTKSFIPLYELNGGRISVDFRSCMSLTMREL